MMVGGSIFVSFFKVTVCDWSALLAESVAVAVNRRFPSVKEETSTITLHVPTGETVTVLEITFGVKLSESETTTNTFVPGSANPLIVTAGVLARVMVY